MTQPDFIQGLTLQEQLDDNLLFSTWPYDHAEERPGRIHTRSGGTVRLDVEPWTLATPELTAYLLSDRRGQQPTEYRKFLQQFGALTGAGSEVAPNYAVVDGLTHFLKPEAGMHAAVEWIRLSVEATRSEPRAESCTYFPTHMSAELFFSITEIADTIGRDRQVAIKLTEHTILLRLLQYHLCGDMLDGMTTSGPERHTILMVLHALAQQQQTVPDFFSTSATRDYLTDMWVYMPDEVRHSPDLDTAHARMEKFLEQRIGWVRRIYNYALTCLKISMNKHQQPDLDQQRAFCFKNMRQARTGGAKMDADLRLVDWATLRVQAEWWQPDIAGVVAAVKWAKAIVLASGDNLELDAERVEAMTRWVFTRSTWRKFVASDTTFDATRDIAASSVTQAAVTPVRLGYSTNPLVLAADDMEYAAVRGLLPPTLHDCWAAVMAALVYKTSAGAYANHALAYDSFVGPPTEAENFYEPIPVFANSTPFNRTEVMVAVPPGEALHVLWHVSSIQQPDIVTTLTTGPEPIPMAVRQHSNGCAWYITPAFFEGQGLDPAMTYLSGMHFRENAFKYSQPMLEFLDDFGCTYERHASGPEIARWLVTRSLPVNTQQHHKHVSLILMMAHAGHVWAPALDNMLNWEDANNAFVCTVMLALASLPPALYVLMISWKGWQAGTMAQFAKNAKNLSTKCKALDNQVMFGDTVLDLAPLFEWDTVLNRGTGSMAWVEEVRDRRDPACNISLEPEDIKPYVREILQEIKDKIVKYEARSGNRALYRTFEEYWTQRSIKTPSGSAATCQTWIDAIKKELRAAGVMDVTKTQVVSMMPDDLKLDDLLGTAPKLVASKSIKYEWGKMRALYAACTEHYIPCAFVFDGIEEYMPDDCPIGKAADAHRVCRKVMEMSATGVTCCLDAANFNILHGHDLMEMVVECAAEEFADILSPEQKRTLKWLASAEREQWLTIMKGELPTDYFEQGVTEGWIIPDPPDEVGLGWRVRLTGGMFSGHRLTMFYNTVFNRAYYRYAADRANVRSRALHSGDDVFAVFDTYHDAYRMKAALSRINYSLQLSKCFMKGVKEFLRISHKNANTSQYLARSAATMVHGRMETGAPTDYLSVVNATLRRGAEIVVRHGNRHTVLGLLMSLAAGQSARWAVPAVTWNAMLKLPTMMGGICPPERSPDHMHCWTITRAAAARGATIKYLASTPGVRASAADIIAQIGCRAFHRRAQVAIAAAMAPNSALTNYGVCLRWVDTTSMRNIMLTAGSLGHIRQSRDYILAKAAGLFNVLAIEKEHWGDLSGLFKDVGTSWHGLALAVALMRVTPLVSRYIAIRDQLQRMVDTVRRNSGDYVSGFV